MPLAKIYVHEGRYDEACLIKLGDVIQTALEETLGVSPEDYFRIYQVLPSNRYVHTPGFLGLTYTDDLIKLEITFIAGRSGDARLTLLRAINERVVSAVGISPDDLVIMVYETAGENISFGRGELNGPTSEPRRDSHTRHRRRRESEGASASRGGSLVGLSL